ncbi:hypothetical protein [Streptomyces sp. BR123]|uniref:hypothetical protein n=1 Tax=Streptomyces sp. BR123 TaxID=2749828 RepID=UPI0028109E68|nr:hypothetical protein [Streptomyces sp. BR123]
MDIGAVVIAVAGMAGTLGGALVTQRAAERAKRRELDLVRNQEQTRDDLLLRRTCYVELNRDARQFTTALNHHLHRIGEGTVEDADRQALDEAKRAHRDRYSEAQMIAPDEVLAQASAVNQALNAVYGQVKRLDRDSAAGPAAGGALDAAAAAREEIWDLLRDMRAAMRRDLGVSSDG